MSDNLQGVFWALVATALFAAVAAMAKVVVGDYHVLQILFFRQVVVLLSALPSILGTFPQGLKTKHPVLHGCRLLGAFVALSSGIWAVALLPLTTATTLAFAQVFFVALLALVFLDEAVGLRRLSAIAIGFAGVLIVMRPGVDGIATVHALVPVGGALGAAIAVVCVRRLSQTDSTATLLAYQAIFVGVLAGLPLFWLWVTPTLSDLVFLLAMGAVAAIAQWIGVRALRLGEVSLIGNIEYMKLVYAMLFGYALFAEVPDGHTLLGAAIIVGSSIYLLHRERIRHGQYRRGVSKAGSRPSRLRADAHARP